MAKHEDRVIQTELPEDLFSISEMTELHTEPILINMMINSQFWGQRY